MGEVFAADTTCSPLRISVAATAGPSRTDSAGMNESTTQPTKKHVVNKANMDQPQEEFIDDSSSNAAPSDKSGSQKKPEPAPAKLQ
jgi:hypothetical protein